jgi:hypothetical protein
MQGRCQHGRHQLSGDSQITPIYPTVCLEFADDSCNRFRRNCESEPDGSTTGRENGRRYANYCAIDGQQWAARIAAVNRRISLQEIDVWIVLEHSSSGRDDTGAYGLAQPERITDRNHCIANGHHLGRTQAKRWQTARIDAEERNIGDSVGTDDLRDDLSPI